MNEISEIYLVHKGANFPKRPRKSDPRFDVFVIEDVLPEDWQPIVYPIKWIRHNSKVSAFVKASSFTHANKFRLGIIGPHGQSEEMGVKLSVFKAELSQDLESEYPKLTLIEPSPQLSLSTLARLEYKLERKLNYSPAEDL